MANLSLKTTGDYLECAGKYLAQNWPWASKTLRGLAPPDLKSAATEIADLNDQQEEAKRAGSPLVRDVAREMAAAVRVASAQLSAIRSHLLMEERADLARALPKRPGKRFSAQLDYLSQVLDAAKRTAKAPGANAKALAARIAALRAAAAGRARAGNAKAITAALKRSIVSSRSRAAAFVGICRTVADLTGNRARRDAAPAQGPSRRRREAASAAAARG